MNLGAFAVVIAVTRKTRSGEISSFGGLFSYAPGLAVAMTIFFASLAGIPPLGGWFAKFNAFKAVLDAGTTSAYVLAAIAAVNTVIAAAYYMRVLRVVWMDEAPDGDVSPVNPPAPIVAAIAITVVRHDRCSACCRTSSPESAPSTPSPAPSPASRSGCGDRLRSADSSLPEGSFLTARLVAPHFRSRLSDDGEE